MNINHDNYESYFLMYLDKELSVEEMREVESFIAVHPELEQEFKNLEAVILQPEATLSFDHKSQLLKFDGGSVEERMLLLLDRELAEPEAGQLARAIQQNALLSAEWETLKSTRLDATETIIFKQKSILYKREQGRVISGRFIKWAVAAALLGAGFFFALRFKNPGDRVNQGSVALTHPKVLAKPAKLIAEQTTQQPEVKTGVADVAVKQVDKDPARQAPVLSSAGKITRESHLVANGSALKNTRPANDNRLVEDHKVYDPIQTSDPVIAQNVTDLKSKKPVEITDINILDLPKNSLAANTALTDEKNDNRIFFMNEDAVTHSKAAGFLRRVKRTIERKTKINTGNSLKIAGFEIAIN